MHLGFILWLIGMPAYCGGLYSFILCIVFILNVLVWRHLEEIELVNRFPAYKDYKKKRYFNLCLLQIKFKSELVCY
jgi:protein-S-isoprenylcysteine O-methyltransferase Ste14